MRNLNRRCAAVWFALALLALSVTPQTLRAQQTTPPSSGRRSAPNNRPSSATQPARNGETVNQRALELEMLSTAGRRDRSDDSVNSRLAKQLIEDFDRLAQIHNDLIAPLPATASLDYKKLSQATGEIKQRASRIKNAFAAAFQDYKGEKVRYEAEPSNLATMLPELGRLIQSFIENPVFRVNSPNDTELRLAAAHDLEAMIKLSEAVNKIAKSLSKSATPNK
jgi:hypothetical protein